MPRPDDLERGRPGFYELDRVAADLLRWPPIAKRVAELEAHKAKTRNFRLEAAKRSPPGRR